jgi:hypothetical protein
MRKGAFTRRWFKPIPGFPDYWINGKGRVYSMRSKKFLQWELNTKWYWRVNLYEAGRRIRYFVHRLVAIIFCPNPKPEEKIEVNHLDYDTQNPYYKNLEWVTPLENRKHRAAKIWSSIGKNVDDGIFCPF